MHCFESWTHPSSLFYVLSLLAKVVLDGMEVGLIVHHEQVQLAVIWLHWLTAHIEHARNVD